MHSGTSFEINYGIFNAGDNYSTDRVMLLPPRDFINSLLFWNVIEILKCFA